MKVIVYVEGPSDRDAMMALLSPLLEQKREAGVNINFRPMPEGDKKKLLLLDAPLRAADALLNDLHLIVVAMPDLYPKNKGFEHETFEELETGMLKRFNNALQRRRAGDDDRLKERFKVFCFKYDLEALVLASEDELKSHLGVSRLEVTWRIPVEDQDHEHPPKQIVEELFRKHSKRYRNTVHAPLILKAGNYRDIAEKCPQCFKPFVEFLAKLQPISDQNQHG